MKRATEVYRRKLAISGNSNKKKIAIVKKVRTD
jgi:hypothetical protein